MTIRTASEGVDRASLLDAQALAQLRDMLLGLRRAQSSLMAEHQRAVSDLTGESDIDSVRERELSDAMASRASRAVDDIEAALARMDADRYGICESCGVPIPIERLKAIPYGRTCVACG